MRQQMEEEQWDLCRLLDAALHGRPAEMLPPAEKYGAILELADRHRVLPLLYDVLAPKLPEEDETRKRLEKICSLRIRKREKRRMRCCMSMDSGKPQSSTHTIISSALAQSRSE